MGDLEGDGKEEDKGVAIESNGTPSDTKLGRIDSSEEDSISTHVKYQAATAIQKVARLHLCRLEHLKYQAATAIQKVARVHLRRLDDVVKYQAATAIQKVARMHLCRLDYDVKYQAVAAIQKVARVHLRRLDDVVKYQAATAIQKVARMYLCRLDYVTRRRLFERKRNASSSIPHPTSKRMKPGGFYKQHMEWIRKNQPDLLTRHENSSIDWVSSRCLKDQEGHEPNGNEHNNDPCFFPLPKRPPHIATNAPTEIPNLFPDQASNDTRNRTSTVSSRLSRYKSRRSRYKSRRSKYNNYNETKREKERCSWFFNHKTSKDDDDADANAPVSDSREGTTQTETNNIEPNAVSTSRRSLVIISGLIFAAVAIGTLEKGSLIDYEMIASVQKRRYVQLYLTGGRTASSDTLSTSFGVCDSYVDLPTPLRPSEDNATTNNSTITYALYLIAIVGIIALLVRTRMPYDPVADGGSNSSAEHQNVNGDSERDNNEFNVSHNHNNDSDNINDF